MKPTTTLYTIHKLKKSKKVFRKLKKIGENA